MKRFFIIALLIVAGAAYAEADRMPSRAWNPNKGEYYVNPVLNADYSDPDVCRVGDDFYMTS